MATLTGQTIASSYEQLLHCDTDGGGSTTTLVPVKDGDNGTTFAAQLSTTTVCVDNPTTSSSTQGGILRLQSDDGAVMASGHRLGVIEFGGAEDTNNTITTGARIEALADAAWSGTENGADMVFYTTDGDASQSEVMRLTADAGTEFTGDIAISDDVTLSSDACVLNFGAGNDVTFTHDNGTGMNVASAGDFDIAVSAGSGTFTVPDGQTLTLGKASHNSIVVSPHGTAGSELMLIQNVAGTTDGAAQAGAIELDAQAGGIGLAWADGKDLWAEGGRFVVTANEDAADCILLHADAGTSQAIQIVNDAGTTDGSDDAGAIELSAAAGGIGLAWADGKDLWAEGGRAIITANEDAADCIKLHADAGTSQTILIQNDAGTGVSAATEVDAAIQLSASAGGIGLYSALNAANAIRLETNAGTSETLILHSNQGNTATSINLLSDDGGITLNPGTQVFTEGTIKMKEQADADSDTAAYGQVWVNTATPNELYFTTDAGNDIALTSGTAIAAPVTALNSASANYLVTVGSTTTELDAESGLTFASNVLTVTGNILPEADGTRDLGSASYQWQNIYTGDLNLNNVRSDGNEVDGTTGSWTIQEGEDNLFLLNRKTGKQYKFSLEEIV